MAPFAGLVQFYKIGFQVMFTLTALFIDFVAVLSTLNAQQSKSHWW